jgi:hypothetical protein
MKKGNKLCSQIYNGTIQLGYDEIYNKKEILDQLQILSKESFQYFNTNNCFLYADFLCLKIKNITYLGHPHPITKKRVQLSKEYLTKINDPKTIITGIYGYKGLSLFAVFQNFDFSFKQLNNSSAHLNISDLLVAYHKGVLRRTDKNCNLILIFNRYYFKVFLDLYIREINKCNDIETLSEWMRNEIFWK